MEVEEEEEAMGQKRKRKDGLYICAKRKENDTTCRSHLSALCEQCTKAMPPSDL